MYHVCIVYGVKLSTGRPLVLICAVSVSVLPTVQLCHVAATRASSRVIYCHNQSLLCDFQAAAYSDL